MIRKLTITALFSDDVLTEKLVLKGRNAISLVYGFGSRGSLDLDFSIDQDFEDFTEARTRIYASLADRFSSVGLVVSTKPSIQSQLLREKTAGVAT